MSIKATFGILVLSCAVFALATLLKGRKTVPVRTFASTQNELKTMPRLAKPSPQHFAIKLVNQSGVARNEDQEMRLKAEVKTQSLPAGHVTYTWILPPGINLVSGELSNTWENVKAGQTAISEISVDGYTPDSGPQVIVFHATVEASGVKVGNSAVYKLNESGGVAEMKAAAQVKATTSVRSSEEKIDYLKRRQGIQY